MSHKTKPKKGVGSGRPAGKLADRAHYRKEIRDNVRPHAPVSLARDPELKVIDTNSSGNISGVNYGGTIVQITNIAQGVGQSQRVGDMVTVRGLQFKIAGYAQGTSQFMRVVCFAWNTTTSVASPTAGAVLQNVGATAQTIAAPYNYTGDEQNTLNILFDRTYQATTAGGPGSFTDDVVLDDMRLPIVFDPASSTGQGKLMLLFISDAVLAGNAPIYQYWSRVFYDDL